MQKLGYIISQTKLRDIADFVELTDDITKFQSDKPAMIVGVETARRAINNFSIINKTAETNKFWTFGKTEKRYDYETDIQKFYNFVLNRTVNSIRYYYIDIATISKQKVKNLLKILSSNNDKYIYISKGMLYMYYNDYVLGISLIYLKYCRINVDRRIKLISKNKHNKIFYSDSNISPYIKQYAKDKKYIIPYFIYLAEKK